MPAGLHCLQTLEESACLSPQLPAVMASLARGCKTLVSASTFLCVCPLLSLARMLVFGVRAQLGNPGRLRLELFNLITSIKTLFPSEVPLTGSEG